MQCSVQMNGVLGHDSATKGYTASGTTWANDGGCAVYSEQKSNKVITGATGSQGIISVTTAAIGSSWTKGFIHLCLKLYLK